MEFRRRDSASDRQRCPGSEPRFFHSHAAVEIGSIEFFLTPEADRTRPISASLASKALVERREPKTAKSTLMGARTLARTG